MKQKAVDFGRLSRRIDELAEKWDTSGTVVLIAGDRVVHRKTYGFADREKNISMSDDGTYLISARSGMLLGLCMMQLIDRKNLSLRDTLDKYIPEYRHASEITIRQLLCDSSGIPDYFYSGKVIELSKSRHHLSLSDEDRFRVERYACESPVTFTEAVAIIADAPLEFKPGSRSNEWSASNALFLQEIIERVSGLRLVDYQREHIFEPLGMNDTLPGCDATTVSYGCIKETVLVRLPITEKLDHGVKTTVEDMVKLVRGMVNRRLLSGRGWKTALAFDNTGLGIVAQNVNGIACGHGSILGYEFLLAFDQDRNMASLHLANEAQRMRWVNDDWLFFRREMRRAIEEETTYPANTSLRPYSDRNASDAVNLAIAESQRSFVSDAKSSLCYALAKPRVRRAYVLMEGRRAVGLMVLSIDKKKSEYYVAVLLVDSRYQNRGFGKIMLSEGLEILKRNGARRIEIGVNRFNVAAQKLYFSLGFEPAAVYEQGMWLRIDLDKGAQS